MISKIKNSLLIAEILATWVAGTINPAMAGVLGRFLFPAQQITVPFEAGQKGAVAVTNYRATRSGSFYFYLILKFDPNQPATRIRAQRIAGTGATRNGILVDTGVPIPVRLVVQRLDRVSDAVVLDRQFQQETLESHNKNSFSKIISSVALPRGNYRVEIEALNDIPELTGIPIDLDIHVPGNLK